MANIIINLNENVYFTSDPHYNSKSIIGYCNRPYSSVEEMNEALYDNYNKVVRKSDKVYLLGDISWTNREKETLNRLNGQKHLVLGNHDTEGNYKKLLGNSLQSISKQKGITVNGQYIWMCHFPMRSWNKSFHGSYMLYGHVHNRLPDYGLSTDVGVDKWNYAPVSFEELREYFKDRPKYYNEEVKNDYESYKIRFLDHFTNKYWERVNSDTEVLNNLLGD